MTAPNLREALAEFIYETTHLSPVEDDGSHWCRISAECLENGRTALREGAEFGWTKAELERWCLGLSRTPYTVLKAFIDAGLCVDQRPSREETRLVPATDTAGRE